MSEGLRDDAWKGRRVFILGRWPIPPWIPQSDLAGEVTLGLNMAFLLNPTATMVYDKRLMEKLSHGGVLDELPGLEGVAQF